MESRQVRAARLEPERQLNANLAIRAPTAVESTPPTCGADSTDRAHAFAVSLVGGLAEPFETNEPARMAAGYVAGMNTLQVEVEDCEDAFLLDRGPMTHLTRHGRVLVSPSAFLNVATTAATSCPSRSARPRRGACSRRTRG